MPRIEGFYRKVQEDPEFDISISGTRLNIHNGFYTISGGNRIKVGDGSFSCDFAIEISINSDNSVNFRLHNVHWNDYIYSSLGNYNTPFSIWLDAITNSGALHRVMTREFTALNSFTQPLNYASDIVSEGVVYPNIAQNAHQDIDLCHYYADGSISDDEAYVGIRVINDLPPTYRPKAVYDCSAGKFLTTNREAGTIKKYNCDNGTWTEIRTANGGRTPADMPAAVYSCNTDSFGNQYQIGANS